MLYHFQVQGVLTSDDWIQKICFRAEDLSARLHDVERMNGMRLKTCDEVHYRSLENDGRPLAHTPCTRRGFKPLEEFSNFEQVFQDPVQVPAAVGAGSFIPTW